MSKTMTVYACGGAGINIVAGLRNIFDKEEVGFATIHPYFVDASDSNMRSDPMFKDQDVYLVEGLDGAAKIRSANLEAISERAKEIIHEFVPGDISLVIHSGSGGSGSVLGPVIVDELLATGCPVIVILVNSTDSGKEVENSYKTIQTYEGFAQDHGVPVVCMYHENTLERPRGRVDADVQSMVALLAVAFSGENRELDTADTTAFLNFTGATGYPAALTRLDVFSKEIALPRGQNVITLLTIGNDESVTRPNVPVEHQSVGFLPTGISPNAVNFELPVHFAVVSNGFAEVVSRLKKDEAAIKDIRNASVTKTVLDAGVKRRNKIVV